MQLSKVDISGELRVTYTNGAEEVWDKQINLFSSVQKVRVMNDFYELLYFDLVNGNEYGSAIGVDIPVANVFVGVGDGIDTTFSGTLGPLPIKAGSTTFSYTVDGAAKTATTNASGVVTGDNITTGTVNQATGVYSLEYSTAPDDGTALTASFTRGSASDDSIVTGFTFELGTDESPTLTEGLFLNTIPLTVAPTKVDRYEQNSYIIYEVTMDATYTGAETGVVTAVGVHYVATSGNSGLANVADNFILKSTEPAGNAVYGSTGLKLANLSNVKLTYRVKVSKS